MSTFRVVFGAYLAAIVLLAFTLAPAARRLSVYSIPEYITRRYGDRSSGPRTSSRT